MAPSVATCNACGKEVRAGLKFCPACARPLSAAISDPARARSESYGVSDFGFTDTWDSVLPRLQEALFGEFVITRELGRGGMAAVFLAHQLKLDRKVAIKVMAPTLMSGLGLVERFRVEATTVAKLDHPNIISIYEVGQATGLQYFVMQYVAGRSLERVLRQYGQLPLSVTQAILFEVGSALAHAHRQQVIHRDVKPGNVLLNTHGRVIVSDFGIAKVAESSAHTQTGAVVGTPAYMSPEQCLGKPLTPAADQYALGIVAYEMLAGVQPFQGSAYTVMRGHTEEPVPDLRALRPDCPPNVIDAIGRMLSKQPGDRFPSIGAALAALGASRMSIDGVEDTLGFLAVPLPGEEGLILVQTPASPAPLQAAAEASLVEQQVTQPPPSGVGTRRLAAARAAMGAVGARAAGTASAIARALGVGWRRATNAAGTAAARSSAAARTLLASAGAGSMRSRVIIGGVVGTITVAALIAVVASFSNSGDAGKPREVSQANSLALSDPDSSALRPNVTDSSSGAVVDSAAVVDSVADMEATDSLAAVVDSTVPSSISLQYDARRGPIVAGDTVAFTATVRGRNGRPIRGLNVKWRVAGSDTTVATIDSLTGALITRRPGSVTVLARTGTVTRRLVVAVNRPPDRSVAVDSGKRDDRAAGARNAAAEEEAVYGAVTAFVSNVLPSKNTEEIRRLYRSRGATDDAELAELLTILRDEKDVRARPQADPPPPSITGDRATADVRIGIRWRKRLRGSTEIPRMVHLSLERGAAGWRVAGFRLSKPGA